MEVDLGAVLHGMPARALSSSERKRAAVTRGAPKTVQAGRHLVGASSKAPAVAPMLMQAADGEELDPAPSSGESLSDMKRKRKGGTSVFASEPEAILPVAMEGVGDGQSEVGNTAGLADFLFPADSLGLRSTPNIVLSDLSSMFGGESRSKHRQPSPHEQQQYIPLNDSQSTGEETDYEAPPGEDFELVVSSSRRGGKKYKGKGKAVDRHSSSSRNSTKTKTPVAAAVKKRPKPWSVQKGVDPAFAASATQTNQLQDKKPTKSHRIRPLQFGDPSVAHSEDDDEAREPVDVVEVAEKKKYRSRAPTIRDVRDTSFWPTQEPKDTPEPPEDPRRDWQKPSEARFSGVAWQDWHGWSTTSEDESPPKPPVKRGATPKAGRKNAVPVMQRDEAEEERWKGYPKLEMGDYVYGRGSEGGGIERGLRELSIVPSAPSKKGAASKAKKAPVKRKQSAAPCKRTRPVKGQDRKSKREKAAKEQTGPGRLYSFPFVSSAPAPAKRVVKKDKSPVAGAPAPRVAAKKRVSIAPKPEIITSSGSSRSKAPSMKRLNTIESILRRPAPPPTTFRFGAAPPTPLVDNLPRLPKRKISHALEPQESEEVIEEVPLAQLRLDPVAATGEAIEELSLDHVQGDEAEINSHFADRGRSVSATAPPSFGYPSGAYYNTSANNPHARSQDGRKLRRLSNVPHPIFDPEADEETSSLHLPIRPSQLRSDSPFIEEPVIKEADQMGGSSGTLSYVNSQDERDFSVEMGRAATPVANPEVEDMMDSLPLPNQEQERIVRESSMLRTSEVEMIYAAGGDAGGEHGHGQEQEPPLSLDMDGVQFQDAPSPNPVIAAQMEDEFRFADAYEGSEEQLASVGGAGRFNITPPAVYEYYDGGGGYQGVMDEELVIDFTRGSNGYNPAPTPRGPDPLSPLRASAPPVLPPTARSRTTSVASRLSANPWASLVPNGQPRAPPPPAVAAVVGGSNADSLSPSLRVSSNPEGIMPFPLSRNTRKQLGRKPTTVWGGVRVDSIGVLPLPTAVQGAASQ